jgi:hypothetical protein
MRRGDKKETYPNRSVRRWGGVKGWGRVKGEKERITSPSKPF